MTNRGLMLFGLTFLILAGCGSNVDVAKEILGEWKGTVPPQDFVFHAGGRVEMKDHSHGVYEGTYSIADGNKLTCTFERLSGPINCTAKISGNKLTLIHSGGREEVYTKK